MTITTPETDAIDRAMQVLTTRKHYFKPIDSDTADDRLVEIIRAQCNELIRAITIVRAPLPHLTELIEQDEAAIRKLDLRSKVTTASVISQIGALDLAHMSADQLPIMLADAAATIVAEESMTGLVTQLKQKDEVRHKLTELAEDLELEFHRLSSLLVHTSKNAAIGKLSQHAELSNESAGQWHSTTSPILGSFIQHLIDLIDMSQDTDRPEEARLKRKAVPQLNKLFSGLLNGVADLRRRRRPW